MTEMWEVEEDHAAALWMKFQDPEGYYRAIVKWDGCTEFYHSWEATWPLDDDVDYDHFHICKIDDLIARLQTLKEIAMKHFGDAWHGD